MRRLLLIIFLFLNVLVANEKVTLQLKWFHQFQFAGYYAAKEKGFYNEVGLDVEIKQRDLKYNNIEQVINGEAEYGVADSILLLYKAKNQPVVIVSSIFQHSPSVLLTLKQSGINSPYKLNKKNILFYPNDTDGFALLSMLKKLDISTHLIRKREKNDYVKLMNKEVDAIPAYLSNEPFYFKEKNIDINIINPTNYGFDLYGDMLFTNKDESLNHPDRVKRFKEATLKGWEYALSHKEEIIKLIHKKYNKTKSVEHLRYEATTIDKLISKDTIALGTVDEGRIQYIYNLYKEYGLISKNIDLKDFVFKEFLKDGENIAFSNKNILTNNENEILKDRVFNIYFTNWEPFMVEGNNILTGLSTEIWDKVVEKSDIKFNYVKIDKFADALGEIKKNKDGIIISTSKTKDKEVYGTFTNSYVSFPIAISTKVDKEFIIDLKSLSGKTVAVGKNYTAYILLKKYYPKIKFIQVDGTRDALDLLANDKVYASADILPVLIHTMNKYNYSDLKISGTSKFNFDVRFMLNKQNKELVPIFNKLIEDIDDEEIQKIVNKWIFTKEITKVDYVALYWVLGIAFTIFILMVYRQYIINKNRDIMKVQKQKFETILNLAYDGLHILDKDGNIIEYSESFSHMLGYTNEEIKILNIKDIDVEIPNEEMNEQIKNLINYAKVFETKHRKKDGSIIDVQVSAKGIKIHGETYLYASAKDITILKDREKERKNYIKLIDENIITSSTNIKGEIIYVSDAFAKISGYEKEELIGKNHRVVRHPDMPNSLFDDLWNTISHDKEWRGEIKNKKKNGEHYWVEAVISPTFNNRGKKTGYTAIRYDITDKKIIEKISITDGLTNIYNRRYFNETFPKFIDSSKRHNDIVCFLIMDIDHFKQYNDNYGHQMGDNVLIKVASALENSLNRADDYCFRLGGEEFGILFKAENFENAQTFSNKVRNNIEELKIEHQYNSASSYITASMGLICKNAISIKDMDEIYKEADELLYKAKESGRNRVCSNNK